MKITLVFENWRNNKHRSLTNTEIGNDLSSGDFHSGSCFEAEIQLDDDTAEELSDALTRGYYPVFYAVPCKETEKEEQKQGYGQCIDCGWYADTNGCNVDRDSQGCRMNRYPNPEKLK